MNLLRKPEEFDKYRSLDYLKKNCTKIHAFGLGFIQVKLGEKERLHLYTSKVTKTSQEEEIHNHRYDFKSTVLQGVLKNKIYEVKQVSDGNFVMVDEACNPDMPKNTSTIIVSEPKLITEYNTGAMQSYCIDKDTFHQVEALENTITLVERGPVVKTTAQIIFPKENQTICPFSVNQTEEELWEILKEAL